MTAAVAAAAADQLLLDCLLVNVGHQKQHCVIQRLAQTEQLAAADPGRKMSQGQLVHGAARPCLGPW